MIEKLTVKPIEAYYQIVQNNLRWTHLSVGLYIIVYYITETWMDILSRKYLGYEKNEILDKHQG